MAWLSLHASVVGHARLGRSNNSTFWAATRPPRGLEDGERTGDLINKQAALRGQRIAFGLTFPNPSGGRSRPWAGPGGRSARARAHPLNLKAPCVPVSKAARALSVETREDTIIKLHILIAIYTTRGHIGAATCVLRSRNLTKPFSTKSTF